MPMANQIDWPSCSEIIIDPNGNRRDELWAVKCLPPMQIQDGSTKDFDIMSCTNVGLSGTWYTTSGERKDFMSSILDPDSMEAPDAKDALLKLYEQVQLDDASLFEEIKLSKHFRLVRPAFQKAVQPNLSAKSDLAWIHIAQRHVLFDRIIWSWKFKDSRKLAIPNQQVHIPWPIVKDRHGIQYTKSLQEWESLLDGYALLRASSGQIVTMSGSSTGATTVSSERRATQGLLAAITRNSQQEGVRKIHLNFIYAALAIRAALVVSVKTLSFYCALTIHRELQKIIQRCHTCRD